MNFYLSAADDLLRHPDDKPSIGIVLCKTKNQVVAEYALRDLAKPVGISSYVAFPLHFPEFRYARRLSCSLLLNGKFLDTVVKGVHDKEVAVTVEGQPV